MAGLMFDTKLRPCEVTIYKRDEKKPWIQIKTENKKKALFHRWEDKSEVVQPSNMIGGHNGGTISGVLAIVEFEDGRISEVSPGDITFIDNKFAEYSFSNPLEHPERYLDDTMAIVDDMTMAQRRGLLKYLEGSIKANGG